MANAIQVEDGKLYSDWQQPINLWQDQPGSIHNDAVATKIGMRGGTIPGTVHLDHFVPIIQERWGLKWYQRGTVSMYYTYATTHKEDVRAGIKTPADSDDVRVDGWIETPEGTIVAKGSLSVGNPREADYVRSMTLESARQEDLRILADLEVGVQCPAADDVKVKEGGGEGEYDGILISPASMYGLLNAGFPRGMIKQAVGFFGATEIALRHGPIRLDRAYRRNGKVICVGASPKTEFAWVDSELIDMESGELVAEMRHLTRWMKASSELWR
ncbi:MAG: hypothetical protein QF828_10630 [Pseudomonadales bacterium]|nr:hypothetical protein [Pseudomonadales bacterium]MDP7358861.1 hypothetical protein [Pseudomonadales bacterium]HJN52674.1 hypothetical protein [Pseudomonadales bacterium]